MSYGHEGQHPDQSFYSSPRENPRRAWYLIGALIVLTLLGIAAKLPAQSGVCAYPTYFLNSSGLGCPVGSTSAECVSTAGSQLNILQTEKNLLNIVGLCRATVATLPNPCTSGQLLVSNGTTSGCLTIASDPAAGTAGLRTLGTGATQAMAGNAAPNAHAASHQAGGADEVATTTPAAGAIPKAGGAGTLGTGWFPPLPYLPDSTVLSAISGQLTSGQLPASYTAPLATALAANPPACSVGQYVTDIAADGTPTCAQVAYSQISGTPASGIVGSLGLTARYFPRAAGTDGVTLEPSPNFYQLPSGDLVFGDLSGARSFWLSEVETAPIFGRNGIAFWIRGNTGGYAPLHVGWAEFQDPSNPVTFAGGQRIANGKSIDFSDGLDYNRGLGRFADGMLGPRDGAGNPMGWKDKGEVNVPQSSPPWACDSAHDGGTYRDSTGPGTRCECFFASGDGWINVFPSRVGSDCS